MPAIIDLWGYDVQNCSCSSSSRCNITTFVGVLVSITTRNCKQHCLQVNKQPQAIHYNGETCAHKLYML